LSQRTEYGILGILLRVSLLVATVFGFGRIIYGASHRRHGAQKRIIDTKQHGRRSDIDCKVHRVTAYE
jgi:hypothetical protein